MDVASSAGCRSNRWSLLSSARSFLYFARGNLWPSGSENVYWSQKNSRSLPLAVDAPGVSNLQDIRLAGGSEKIAGSPPGLHIR